MRSSKYQLLFVSSPASGFQSSSLIGEGTRFKPFSSSWAGERSGDCSFIGSYAGEGGGEEGGESSLKVTVLGVDGMLEGLEA